MPYFSHADLQFHYLERGAGVPVGFQHGLGGEAEKTLALLELPAGFSLLGLDCRAHGKTAVGPHEELRFATFADDVMALLDHLKVEKGIIGGTSMGAGVALNCALRYPQRVLGLILLRPAWLDQPNESNLKMFGLIAQLLREHGPKGGQKHFTHCEKFKRVARESRDSAESLLALFSDPRAIETVARLELIPKDAPNHDRGEWKRIAVPTLVLGTEKDPVHPFEYAKVLAKSIPGAQLESLTPKSIDLAQYTADLNRCLASFLEGHFLC